MCDPITLAVVGTGVSAIGGMQAASASAAEAKFQQKIALDNADRTTEQMRDARERGADAEQQVRLEGANSVANTRAALASNNMDLTTGSPLDTIIQASMEVDRDAYRTRRNTDSEVHDLAVQRTNYRNNASAQGAAASNAKTAGFIAGVGTALGGATNIQNYKASIA